MKPFWRSSAVKSFLKVSRSDKILGEGVRGQLMAQDEERYGPKSTEDDVLGAPKMRTVRGLTLRAMLPNAVTVAALCAGLTGVRFAIGEEWAVAVALIVFAGVLDGVDGRIARLLNAQSRFGAELDSLADNVSFGVAPALVLFMWALQDLPRFGWLAALAFAICMALRLARFNAQIDLDDQPHKLAGFLTGIPAPVAAGLSFLPFYCWTITGNEVFRTPLYVAIWIAAIAFLMISNVATLSWASIRPRRQIRLELLALAGLLFVGLVLEPWWVLLGISASYLALLPYGLWRYAKVKRQDRV